MSIRQSIFALSLAAVFLSLAVVLCLAIIFFLVFRGSEEPDRELVQIPTAAVPHADSCPADGNEAGVADDNTAESDSGSDGYAVPPARDSPG